MAINEKVVLEGEDRVSQALQRASGAFEDLAKEMKQTADASERVEDSSEKASKGFGKMGTALKGLAIGAAAVQMARLGAATVGLAIDAEEAASAFGTVFGPATDRAQEFVEEFANKAGFARGELQQMLAVTGNVVQGLGATEGQSFDLAQSMATLAGDVASFSNAAGGSEAVLAALQSAIGGEREALKTYGIALSEAEVQQKAFTQTGKSSADELTRLEKANATVALAYEKAGKAVGDLDRTSGGAANTIRRLQAMAKEAGTEVGSRLLPAVEQMLPVLEELIPAIGDAAAAIAGAFASAGPTIAAIARQIPSVIEGFKLISNSATNVGAGFAAAALEIVTFGQANTEALQATANAAAEANDLNNVLREFRLGRVPGADAAAQYANALLDLANKGSLTEDAISRVADAADISAERQQDALITLRNYGLANDFTEDEIQMLNEALGENAVAAGAATEETAEHERMLRLAGAATEDLAEAADRELSPAMEALQQRMAEAALEAQRTGEAFAKDLLGDMDEFQTGLEGAVEKSGITLDTWQANWDERFEQQQNFWANLATLYGEGFDALADEIAEGGIENASLAQEAAGDLERAADLDDMVRSTESDLERWSNAVANAATGNDTVLAIYREFGIDLARAIAMGFDQFDLASNLDMLIDQATGAAVPTSSSDAPVTSSGEPLIAPGGQIGFATGGVVPGSPNQEVPAVLHGTEVVIPPEGSSGRSDFTQALARQLAGMIGSSNGGGQLAVNIRVDQDGQVIGATVEAQSENLTATVERLVRR